MAAACPPQRPMRGHPRREGQAPGRAAPIDLHDVVRGQYGPGRSTVSACWATARRRELPPPTGAGPCCVLPVHGQAAPRRATEATITLRQAASHLFDSPRGTRRHLPRTVPVPVLPPCERRRRPAPGRRRRSGDHPPAAGRPSGRACNRRCLRFPPRAGARGGPPGLLPSTAPRLQLAYGESVARRRGAVVLTGRAARRSDGPARRRRRPRGSPAPRPSPARGRASPRRARARSRTPRGRAPRRRPGRGG